MGAPHYTVALQKIAAEQGLTVLHAAQDYATREIRTADVNRKSLLPVLFTELIGRAHAQNSRRIDQHVQSIRFS